ncbi:hypothetical protein M407DRAFT_241939 [Tulasnella calospora MUT 4182]|uniref:Large ribosomal subunit protein uL6 alpha-beta domain-containing protein n=1 Tax=Tulasnella calospora MUT 4182 TaxID=1051891 RepID=A0A0C3QSL6_9AGAM|nr:hypothetical protein M407DRAFT_241939 [Tulasnella calospora MUT 4182]
MKNISETEDIKIPSNVKINLKGRVIEVEGPRGKLQRDLHHVNVDLKLLKTKKGDLVHIVVWHGNRKQVACLRTIKSCILNLIKGVTQGFLYKMRLVYAHFPINCIIGDGGDSVEIRNFLGEKIVRKVNMLDGVKISESTGQKDELTLQGNDINNVSQSAASIKNSCLVRNKDIRKFLDGIYVSEKTVVEELPEA